MLSTEVERRPSMVLPAVPETGKPPRLGSHTDLITGSYEVAAGAASPGGSTAPQSRTTSELLMSPGRQDSGAGSEMAAGPGGSEVYLLVLELINEEQLELAADVDASAIANEILDLDAPDRSGDLDPGKEVLFYAQGGEPGTSFCLFLDNCTDEELTTVRVVAPNVPGVLASVTTAFEQEGPSNRQLFEPSPRTTDA